jgi:hypothetical protein
MFSLVGLGLALAGTGVFLALAIHAWSIKAEVNRQTNDLAAKANTAADAADHAVELVGEVINKAKVDLADTRAKVSIEKPVPVNHFVQIATRQASIKLAGSLERALGGVVTASDSVVVAQAALDIVTANPQLEKVFGVDEEKVTQTRSTLESVAGELRQARSILGVPVSADGEPPTPEQLDAVDRALGMADGFRAEMARIIATSRVRVNETRALIDLWAWRLAWGTTVLCGVAIVGQLFMARYCMRRLQNLPA